MPKLYYSVVSCGAASFIAAFTAKVQLQCEQVDHKTHLTGASGVDFYSVNPKGNVPCLVLDDGTVLNENIAVLQYIADQAADGVLAPSKGTISYYLFLTTMSYIATEVHQSIGALLRPNLNHQETRAHLKDRATYKLAYLEDHLISDKQFLVDDSFTVADVYMFVCLRSSGIAGLDLTEYPKVSAYLERIRSMECITAAQARMTSNPQMVL